MEAVFENKENVDNYHPVQRPQSGKKSEGLSKSWQKKRQELKAKELLGESTGTNKTCDDEEEDFGTPMSSLSGSPDQDDASTGTKEPAPLSIEELVTEGSLVDPIERVKKGKMHFSSSTGDVAKGQQNTNIANPDLRRLIRCIATALEGMVVSDPREPPADVGPEVVFFEKFHSLTAGSDKTRGKPHADNIASFMRRIFRSLSLSVESAVMGWVYINRLVEEHGFVMYASSWRSVLLAAIIVAAKVWNEPRVWNSSFLRVADNVTVEALNQMERALLNFLNFNVFVSASTYATHYFKLDGLLEQTKEPLTPINKYRTKVLEQRSALSEKKARQSVRRLGPEFM